MKYKELRKKYPKFIYKDYSWKISGNNLKIFFDFQIKSNGSINSPRVIHFRPEIVIKNTDTSRIRKIEKRVLNNFIFHLGLIELPSYWKATCSPEIEIQTGYLNREQIRWWKDLIINGMSQFFYENKINFLKPNFFKITCSQKFAKKPTIVGILPKLKSGVLVPIGGGKDSIVTLEVLKHANSARSAKASRNANAPIRINCFSLNPTKPALKIMKVAGYKNPIIVERKIDEKLLELNRKGFLNGHTPFSTYLAFLSTLLALIFDFKYIAFSNERSSNEGNVKYLGKIINHQYSKSFDFEKKFRHYSKKYLSKGIEYFSFLRPLYEIQIAKLFSKFPKYFPIFLSCNEAFKTNSGKKKQTEKWCCTPNQSEARFGTSPAPCRHRRLWCGDCPKCLFVFATLYPFLGERKLIKIFGPARNASHSDAGGKNLFKKKKLLPIMLELIGERKFKPFECVGTRKESLIAFYLSFKKYRGSTPANLTPVNLPVLLKYFEKKILPEYNNLERELERILNSWNNYHNLSKEFEKALRREL